MYTKHAAEGILTVFVDKLKASFRLLVGSIRLAEGFQHFYLLSL